MVIDLKMFYFFYSYDKTSGIIIKYDLNLATSRMKGMTQMMAHAFLYLLENSIKHFMN